ncbi:MAG: alpha/beta hydrolase [Anaerolineae bacterium]|nr:alpha/beta hydrolase [Anaerolineae bacterium]
MSVWQSGNVASNGIQMHYMRTGCAKPPIVLAHGVTDDGLCWTPVAEALAPDYDVIMVDARGHGRSEATGSGYDPATQATDIHGVITGLGLHKPLLLGHSMGAITVLALAGLYPDTPRAVLLEDPPAFWLPAQPTPPRRSQDGQAGPAAWLNQLKGKTREQLIAEARVQNPAWSEAELGPWADAKLLFSPTAVLNIFGSNTLAAIDWPATLQCITCSTLAIMADPERSAALRPDGLKALQSYVPQLEAVHIAGAGHNIRREQFARYMEVVRSFLDRVAAVA